MHARPPLHSIDDAAAARILESHPPAWENDAVFDAAWEKYQVAGTPPQTAAPRRRILPLYRLVTAACVVMVLALFRQLVGMESNQLTPPPIIQEQTTTTAVTTVSTFSTPSAVTETSVSSTASSAAEAHTTSATGAPVVVLPVYSTTTAAAPAVTETTAASSAAAATTTATEPTTTAPPPTTTMTTPTEQPKPAWGYFEIHVGGYNAAAGQPGNGSLDEIVYVRTNPDPPLTRTHTMDDSAFCITARETLADGTEQLTIAPTDPDDPAVYTIRLYDYDRLSLPSDPRVFHALSYFTIRERPAFSSETAYKLLLMWDDGCHICVMQDSPDRADAMEQIARGFC